MTGRAAGRTAGRAGGNAAQDRMDGWQSAGRGPGDSSFTVQPTALLIADKGGGRGALEEALTHGGARLLAPATLDRAVATLAAAGPVDLLAIDLRDAAADDDTLATIVDAVAHYADDSDARVLMAIDRAQIDLALAQAIGGRHIVLCEPSAVELFGSVALALAHDDALMLNDAARDSEAVRLQRLNEEVARIAETLARLARNDARPARAPAAAVTERPIEYRGEPTNDAPPVSASEVRQLIRARRLRDQLIVGGLFEDPAWDMLLDLYAAQLERVQVSVSSLCIAAAVAPTTALRWIGRMTDAGLFDRQADPFDRRRAYLALSAAARQAMTGYFETLKKTIGPTAIV